MNKRTGHTALQALLAALAPVTAFAAFPAAARARSGSVRRPAVLVYAAPRGRAGQIDVYAAGVRRRWIRRLTRDKAAETAVQCVAGGKHVVYVADGKVYSVAISPPGSRRRRRRRRARKKPAPAARVAPVLLGTLPQDLWQQHYAESGKHAQWVQRAEQRRDERPDDPHAQLVWGLVCQRIGNRSGATEAYQAAMALDPDDYYAMSRLAECMLREGDLEQAALKLSAALSRPMPRSEYLRLAKQTGGLAASPTHRLASTCPWEYNPVAGDRRWRRAGM